MLLYVWHTDANTVLINPVDFGNNIPDYVNVNGLVCKAETESYVPRGSIMINQHTRDFLKIVANSRTPVTVTTKHKELLSPLHSLTVYVHDGGSATNHVVALFRLEGLGFYAKKGLLFDVFYHSKRYHVEILDTAGGLITEDTLITASFAFEK